MRLRLEFVGRGAKWSLVALQLACLLNSYLVTGVDDKNADISTSESRSPYVYLAQREYVINPSSGQYEEVSRYRERNETTTHPPTTTNKTTLRKLLRNLEATSAPEQDQSSSASVTNQRFENAYTRYNIANNNGIVKAETVNTNPGSIQDILSHRQGQYTTTPGYTSTDSSGNPGQASYDSPLYQSPLVSYEVPSNYFPNEHFDWPSTYTSSPYGPPQGPTTLVAPFLSGVGQLTGAVKHVQAQLGEQKAKTAYQVADVVKNTGYAVNNAILSKGQAAGHVIGQTIQTAGEALKSKGHTAQKIIANKGQLATSAIQSVGNIGSSLLRSKGELIGAVLKTGSHIGTTALGTASNALAGGTHLIRAKGDAASNLIAKGGRLASGVIGTKGRLISSVINAKGQFVAQIVEAKGRAAATLLETSGQKLTQLAEAIKSATQQKNPQPGWGGWGSAPSESYSAPPTGGASEQAPQKEEPEAQLQVQEEPVISNHQHAQYQQTYHQDYADSYYDPRDNYRRSASEDVERNSNEEERQRIPTVRNSGRRSRAHRQQQARARQARLRQEEEDQEDFQNEYSSYYQPHHYSSPSAHQDYAQYSNYQWE